MGRIAPAVLLLGAVAIAGCATEPRPVEPTAPSAPATAGSRTADGNLIALGKAIFFDERLSLNQNQSCASCHDPAWGWTGPNSAVNAASGVYEGSIPGALGNRKPPSSAYATLSPVLHYDGEVFVGGNFWDGRATGQRLGNPAVEQALRPFLNPVEQALPGPADLLALICEGPYGVLFRQMGGDAVCDPAHTSDGYDFVGFAVAAYEGGPESNAFTSKFDYFLEGKARLSPRELLGLALFRGRGRCSACHVLDGMGRGLARGSRHRGRPLFTDFTFDNLGLPKNPANPQGLGFTDPGLGGFLLRRPEYAAFGPANLGKHKVPTLRNVDHRPSPGSVKAFGHNGYFKSLESFVHFYNTRDTKPQCPGPYAEAEALAAGCWPAPEYAATMNRTEVGDLGLTTAQEKAIVAFLKTLSDGYTPLGRSGPGTR